MQAYSVGHDFSDLGVGNLFLGCKFFAGWTADSTGSISLLRRGPLGVDNCYMLND